MKANYIIVLLIGIGTAVSVGSYLFMREQYAVPEPLCNYVDEFGNCFETRIY